MKISSVILTAKKMSTEAFSLALQIKAWLEEQGVQVFLPSGPADESACQQDLPAADLIIILGGDGTILSQARKLLTLEVPFLGINLGRVGFMAEISPDSWRDQLAGIMAGDHGLSRRVVLSYELNRGRDIIERGCSINEVVINRGAMARLITVELELPGGVRQEIRSDGIIFSTPTGSTAYAVSAGGPLVHPDLEAMVVTPICPFLHDFKPVVFPSTETITACIPGSETEAWLTVDGQLGFRLKPGDMIRIFRHAIDLNVLCSPSQSFAAKLEAKGFLKRRQ